MKQEKAIAENKVKEVLTAVLSRNGITNDEAGFRSLDSCETFISRMVRIRRVSGLAIALMFVHIRDSRLYPSDLTWEQYRSDCRERLDLNASDIWRYEAIGDAYVMYRANLEAIGFSERGDVTKLMYLNRAVVQHGRKQALKSFASMSKIEFELWVKGKAAKIPYNGTHFGVTQKALLYQNHEVISFEDIQAISDAGKLDDFRRMVKDLRGK